MVWRDEMWGEEEQLNYVQRGREISLQEDVEVDNSNTSDHVTPKKSDK